MNLQNHIKHDGGITMTTAHPPVTPNPKTAFPTDARGVSISRAKL